MKIEMLRSLFLDQGLQDALLGVKKPATSGEMLSGDVTLNLFNSPKKDKFIPLYLNVLKEKIQSEPYCKRLLEQFKKQFAKQDGLSEQLQKKCKTNLKLFEKQVVGKDEPTKKPKSKYGKFPEATCKLSELRTWAKDAKTIESYLKEIKNRSKKKDPELTSKSKLIAKKPGNKKRATGTFPWDHNHSGKVINGVFVNASDVNIPGIQKYIFAGCPRDTKNIGDYYDVLLKKGVKVIVTVNKIGEQGNTPGYWTNKELSKVKLRDGWKISAIDEKRKDIIVGTKPVFTSDVNPKKMSKNELAKWRPRVQESHIVATKGAKKHEFIHLYHDNWHDHKAPPDLKVLKALADRIDKYATKDIPIAINCHGGIGRTGTIALINYGRRKIDAELKKGKALDKITLNLPEMLYEFRQQRQGMIGNKGQLPAVYKSLASYYEYLKAKGSSKKATVA
jgi:protein tyrosine phosphatase